jgi:hypothetical protein
MKQEPFCGIAPEKSDKKMWHGGLKWGKYNSLFPSPRTLAMLWYQNDEQRYVKCIVHLMYRTASRYSLIHEWCARYLYHIIQNAHGRQEAWNTPDARCLSVKAHVDVHDADSEVKVGTSPGPVISECDRLFQSLFVSEAKFVLSSDAISRHCKIFNFVHQPIENPIASRPRLPFLTIDTWNSNCDRF